MLTTTHEISRREWPAFFDAFSRRHASWLVTVEICSPEIGAQVEADSLTFEGVSADLRVGADRIAIALGELPGSRLTHVISAPTRVRLERTDLDLSTLETLEIESESGATTLVRFAGAAEAEDGGVR